MIVSDKPAFLSVGRILLMVVLGGFMVIGQGVDALVGTLIYGTDFLFGMADPDSHPGISSAILIAQGVGSIVGLILIPWLYLKFSEHKNIQNFFHQESNWPMVAIAVMFGIITMAIATSPIVEWNANIEFPEWMAGFGKWAKESEALAAKVTKSITNNMTPASFILTFLVVAVVAGIGEELVFRGLLQTELSRAVKNPHVGIWVTAILFSAVHFQFMGFVPRVIMGAFMGYLYYWSGNLWIPMLAHFFNNGIQVIALYLYQLEVLKFDIESPESAPWPAVIISFVAMCALLLYLKNYFISRSITSSGTV